MSLLLLLRTPAISIAGGPGHPTGQPTFAMPAPSKVTFALLHTRTTIATER